MRYGYLVVEGPHDVAFIGRVLRLSGLGKVQYLRNLDKYWRPIIPTSFPHRDDLLKRVPIPSFFQSATHSVALHSVGGVARLVPSIEETLTVLEKDPQLSALGLFADADTSNPQDRFLQLKTELARMGLNISDTPGTISIAGVRTGVFIFPDNRNPGTLDNLLDECAAKVYSSLRDEAVRFRSAVDRSSLSEEDLQEVNKTSGETKVVLGCVANFLRPTGAIQNSIEDNNWLSQPTIALVKIETLFQFVKDLLAGC